MAKTIVHVNQHVIKANRKNGTTNPPLTIKSGKHQINAYEATLVGAGRGGRMTHSPLPLEKHGSCVLYADGTVFADGLTDEQANLVIRAVNAHDELVAALKIVTDCLESYVEQQYPDYYREYPSGQAKYEGEMSVVKDARAALAKAGA